ncbi:MAG: nuclear transport factor 2 family protein [Dichotomicrobium sp.]
MTDAAEIIRTYFRAYERKNRQAVEDLLAADFRFTSPYHDNLDRDSYFARCWPYSAAVDRVDIGVIAGEGEHWFVRYELEMASGVRFRNVEFFAIRGGLVERIEVYIGDSLSEKPPALDGTPAT